jgi:hypothetical protein
MKINLKVSLLILLLGVASSRLSPQEMTAPESNVNNWLIAGFPAHAVLTTGCP